MMLKNHWTPQIMGFIDWEVHRLAIQRHSDNRTHIVKLVHDILPTNRVVSWHNEI